MDSVCYRNLWFLPRNSRFSLLGLKDNAINFHQQEDILEKFLVYFSLVAAGVGVLTDLQLLLYALKNGVETTKDQHLLIS